MTASKPTDARLESLDVLRGVAVLGIFAMNVQAFAQIPHAYDNPTVGAVFSESDLTAWRIGMVIFADKFMALFTALFGASMLVMLGETNDPSVEARHNRRMAWLALLGALHALAVWYGDVLLLYAVAGVMVHPARLWSANRLVTVGAGLILVTAAVMALVQLYRFDHGDGYKDALAFWSPTEEEAEDFRQLYQSPWHERVVGAAEHALVLQFSLVTAYLPRTVGVMMMGMALWRSGFLHARLPVAAYLAVALLAPVGAWTTQIATRGTISADFDFLDSAAWRLVHSLVSLPQALGYAALVMLAVKASRLRWLRAPFAAGGRLALSNYLGCSIAGALVFFGPPGLGLIGTLGRADQAWVVLTFWVVMLVSSSLWLRFYRFGPMEWILRSLTYQRLQPIRRRVRPEPA